MTFWNRSWQVQSSHDLLVRFPSPPLVNPYAIHHQPLCLRIQTTLQINKHFQSFTFLKYRDQVRRTAPAVRCCPFDLISSKRTPNTLQINKHFQLFTFLKYRDQVRTAPMWPIHWRSFDVEFLDVGYNIFMPSERKRARYLRMDIGVCSSHRWFRIWTNPKTFETEPDLFFTNLNLRMGSTASRQSIRR